MLHRLPDDIDYDRAIEAIYVIQRYDRGLDDICRGDVFEDEEVMAEFLGDGLEETARVDAARESRSA